MRKRILIAIWVMIPLAVIFGTAVWSMIWLEEQWVSRPNWRDQPVPPHIDITPIPRGIYPTIVRQ